MSLCAECGWTGPEPPAACAREGCPLLPWIFQRRGRLMSRLGQRPSEPVPVPAIEYGGGQGDPGEGMSYNYSSRDASGYGIRV